MPVIVQHSVIYSIYLARQLQGVGRAVPALGLAAAVATSKVFYLRKTQTYFEEGCA